MRSCLFVFLMAALACNEPNKSGNDNEASPDTMPTVQPEMNDTSRVVTPPPTGDSNVVHPDTSIKSK